MSQEKVSDKESHPRFDVSGGDVDSVAQEIGEFHPSFDDSVAREDYHGNRNHRKSISKVRRDFRKRKHKRLVYKNGDYNLSHGNIENRRQRFLADIFTTMLDIKWRWILLLFVLAFITSWLLFGLVWWLICFTHEDFKNYGDPDWEPCVDAVYDFTTALLFSVETQHTIGYGGRATTPYCPEAIIVMMAQSCLGTIIQALMTGLVFAKLSRSKKRAETLMFSKNALISKRDGKLCLLIRLGDMRKTNLIDSHVRGILIRKRITEEGEGLPLYQHEVTFGREDTDSRLFLVWPITVEHVINEHSPLWDLGPEDFAGGKFELIVILEGTVGSTGTTAQARTSYLPGEILWGRRFQRLVTLQKENGEYKIDYSLFHSSLPMNIPMCSARRLAEMEEAIKREDRKERRDSENSISASGLETVTSQVHYTSQEYLMTSEKDMMTSENGLVTFKSISTQTFDVSDGNDSEDQTEQYERL